jgi:hypothetical protein
MAGLTSTGAPLCFLCSEAAAAGLPFFSSFFFPPPLFAGRESGGSELQEFMASVSFLAKSSDSCILGGQQRGRHLVLLPGSMAVAALLQEGVWKALLMAAMDSSTDRAIRRPNLVAGIVLSTHTHSPTKQQK